MSFSNSWNSVLRLDFLLQIMHFIYCPMLCFDRLSVCLSVCHTCEACRNGWICHVISHRFSFLIPNIMELESQRPPAVIWCPRSSIYIMDLPTLWTIPFCTGVDSVTCGRVHVGTGMDSPIPVPIWTRRMDTAWLAYGQRGSSRCRHRADIWTDKRDGPGDPAAG